MSSIRKTSIRKNNAPWDSGVLYHSGFPSQLRCGGGAPLICRGVYMAVGLGAPPVALKRSEAQRPHDPITILGRSPSQDRQVLLSERSDIPDVIWGFGSHLAPVGSFWSKGADPWVYSPMGRAGIPLCSPGVKGAGGSIYRAYSPGSTAEDGHLVPNGRRCRKWTPNPGNHPKSTIFGVPGLRFGGKTGKRVKFLDFYTLFWVPKPADYALFPVFY